MNSKNIFKLDSYKDIVRSRLVGSSNRGQLTKAANFINCQRSYLSRILSEKMHLTSDHAFNLSVYFKFTRNEREYFLMLVEFERSSSLEYRSHLKTRLKEMKRQSETIQEKTQRQSLSVDSSQLTYFSTWLYSAIHFLTSIPAYQNVDNLSDHLNVPKKIILSYLENLKIQKFVDQIGEKWIYKLGEFHAPKDSPLVLLHHQNWRTRAIIDAQNFENESIHYTAVQTMSFTDAEAIRSLLLDFISTASAIASPSKSETGQAMTIDFFKI